MRCRNPTSAGQGSGSAAAVSASAAQQGATGYDFGPNSPIMGIFSDVKQKLGIIPTLTPTSGSGGKR